MITAFIFGNSHAASWTGLDAIIFLESVKSFLASVGIESKVGVSGVQLLDGYRIAGCERKESATYN